MALKRNVKKLGCVSQDGVPPSIKSILRKGRKSSRSNLRFRYTPDAVRCIKLRERKGHSLEVVQSTYAHERSCFARKFEDRTPEQRQQKSDVPTEHHGIWQQVCTTFMETCIKAEPRSSRPRRIVLPPSTITLEQSGFPGPQCTC